MAEKIVVDPITRIEGHLRIDVEVDDGRVTKAWSSGQMFRGIETILQGRDPREAWLFTQRFCGVCTTVHAVASVRAPRRSWAARSAVRSPQIAVRSWSRAVARRPIWDRH